MIFFILIWSICAVGFFSLASSMNKHQKQIYGKILEDSKTRLATIVGWSFLITGFIICICSGNLSNMISYWLGVLTFSTFFVGLSLSYFANKIKYIWIASGVIAISCLIAM